MDFMPDKLRGELNGGIGGYVSQRRKCARLKPCAPRTDEDLIPLLCDLLVVTSAQLHERLRFHLDRLTQNQCEVKKEFFCLGRSLGIYSGHVTKRFDDTNIYRVTYNDGDVEDYNIEELLPLLHVTSEHRNNIESTHRDLVTVLEEAKKPFPREYLYRPKLLKKEASWFGPTLRARRELSVSLMNFCVFHHSVDECSCDNGVDPWARSTLRTPCVFRHDASVCKCNLTAIKLSQDECSYAAYMLQKREWKVQGKHTLRKKAPGQPLMVSDYASFEFGFGFKISDRTLVDVNRLREGEHYKEVQNGRRVLKRPLAYYHESDTITIAVMQPGENKDGTPPPLQPHPPVYHMYKCVFINARSHTYMPTVFTSGWWTLDKILQQAEDVMDVLRVVAPPRLYQYIPYYDNSSTHNKREDMTLSCSKLNAKWGGRQIGLRDSKLVKGCVGNIVAVMYYLPGQGVGEWQNGPKWVPEGTNGAVEKVCTLKDGDIDHGQFQPDDPPPFYELDAQRYDRPMTDTEKREERDRRSHLRDVKLQKKRTSMRDVEVELTTEELDEFSEVSFPLVVYGYVGKPKGSRMHVWSRGRWRKGMTHSQCCKILSCQPDFMLETSRLEKWWIHEGHGATKTVTSTPEAVEVEYDWGKGKYEFRNHINTQSTRLEVYRTSVLRSLGRHQYISRSGVLRPPPLPRRRHWRFIRKANDYLRAYSLFTTPLSLRKDADKANATLHGLIEKTRKRFKSHRCAGEQEFGFTVSDDPNDQLTPEDDLLCERYLIDDIPHSSIGDQVSVFLRSLDE